MSILQLLSCSLNHWHAFICIFKLPLLLKLFSSSITHCRTELCVRKPLVSWLPLWRDSSWTFRSTSMKNVSSSLPHPSLPSPSFLVVCLLVWQPASYLKCTRQKEWHVFFFTAPAKHEHVLMHERSSMHPEIFVLCEHNRLLLRRHLVGITLNSIGVFVVSGCSIK